jgi:hypothetical protein
MTDARKPLTASRAALQAIWTVAIGIVIYLVGRLIIDMVTGVAEPTVAYVGALIVSLGLRTVIWAIWVVAIAVRFREEPPRRRAQLATAAGLIVAVIDGVIIIISSLASGAFGTAAVTFLPIAIGVVVFIVASAAGGYGSIPIAARTTPRGGSTREKTPA